MSETDRIKWDARYRKTDVEPPKPSTFLLDNADHLPCSGRCLDVAGGAGRNGLWLAARGLDVTIADISAEGLKLAQTRAAAAGFSIATAQLDLEDEPLPAGPWDVVFSMLYLQRDLYAKMAAVLAPGGTLLAMQPTLTNLERHAKPPAPFLLRPGELATLLPSSLEVLLLTEQWSAQGQHQARVVARRR